MVLVPVAKSVMAPDEEPITTIAVLLLVHAPDADPSLRLDEEPRHIFGAPVIAAGAGYTVTIAVE